MADFSQTEIEALISCPKAVAQAPARSLKLEGAHWRNDAKLVATDGTKGSFAVFIRRNVDFPENFSVGLTYNANDGRTEIRLLRCNGKHGVYNRGKAGFNPNHPHYDFHIHRASESALESGSAAEKDATATTEYASLEEAVQYFVRTVNLNPVEAARYFPSPVQGDFDFDGA